LIAQIAGDRTLTDQLAEQIADRTDGVPLFVQEMTKSGAPRGRHPHRLARLTNGAL
jgi:predicted ATPase